MKNLILALLIVALGCTKSADPAPATTKFTSMSGSWKFSNTDVSGQFNIVTTNGKYYVEKNADAFIIIKGTKYPLTYTTFEVTGTWPTVTFQLVAPMGLSTASITFTNAVGSTDFTTIKADNSYYFFSNTNSPVLQPSITITRQ